MNAQKTKTKAPKPKPSNTVGSTSSPTKTPTKCRGGCAHQAPTATSSQTESSATMEDKEESLRQANLELKAQQQELEKKLDNLQSEYNKSMLINTRLESLCTELKNRTKVLKVESASKIQEAEERGKALTKEVSGNLGFMENINENLQQITKENLESRKYNENLAKQISDLKIEYEKKEATTQEQIKETNDKIVKAHMELAETKLENSQDKEKTYAELKTLATAIVESREQMQIIKETELSLRKHIQNYDEKFVGLQTALKETNAAYDAFKGEMETIAVQAKDLESDSTKWHNKWEETNIAQVLAEQTHARLQAEVQRTSVSLEKMTNLYKALEKDQKQMEIAKSGQSKPKAKQETKVANSTSQSIKSECKKTPDLPEPLPKNIPIETEHKPEKSGLTPKSTESPKQLEEVQKGVDAMPKQESSDSKVQGQSSKANKKKRKGKNK